jgi:hypothetical protein
LNWMVEDLVSHVVEYAFVAGLEELYLDHDTAQTSAIFSMCR